MELLKSADMLPSAKSHAFEDSNHDVLVFVHGFYVAFEESIRRAAQIAHELNFDGTVFVFTWPSAFEMSPSGYSRDKIAVERSAVSFRDFLFTLGRRYGNRNIKVLAHSLGCRLVAKAARLMAAKQRRNERCLPKLSNILLAAPDIPITDFRTYDSQALTGIASRVTVYCSTKDRFLRFADELDSAGRRLGQSAGPHGREAATEFVDYSQIPGGPFDLHTHNRYREHRMLLKDIRGVLVNTIPKNNRRINGRTDSQKSFGARDCLRLSVRDRK